MNKKEPKSISDIIYGKLFYKEIKILVFSAIFFFILTVLLFILYQLKIANMIFKQVEINFENFLSESMSTTSMLQNRYANFTP